MADQDQDDKQFEATQQKLDEAKKRGEVPISPEVRHAVMFGGILASVLLLVAHTGSALAGLGQRLWGGADIAVGSSGQAVKFSWFVLGETGYALALPLALMWVCAVLTAFMQGQFVMTWSRLKPKWDKLLVWKGLARLFGKQALVEFLKTLAKAIALIVLIVVITSPRLNDLERLVGSDPTAAGSLIGALLVRITGGVVIMVVALAIFDVVWQRMSFAKKMRMSFQEMKDEHKQQEGDPKVKGRIRQIQAERARNRMMADVPKAAVVITNPTHYSVALAYDHDSMGAPVVVAKGVDGVAFKIREIAKDHNIPIMEAPPLARALYAAVDVGKPIKTEHYRAVAEIISKVMKLLGNRR